MLTASAIQYYWIYTEHTLHEIWGQQHRIQYWTPLEYLLQAWLSHLVSHNDSIIHAPAFLLSKVYRGLFTFSINSTQVTSHRQKFKLFFFDSSCNWDNIKLCNFLPSWGQCIRIEARHFEWLSSTQFVYPQWSQRQSRYKKSICYRFDSKCYWSPANRNYQCEGEKVF